MLSKARDGSWYHIRTKYTDLAFFEVIHLGHIPIFIYQSHWPNFFSTVGVWLHTKISPSKASLIFLFTCVMGD